MMRAVIAEHALGEDAGDPASPSPRSSPGESIVPSGQDGVPSTTARYCRSMSVRSSARPDAWTASGERASARADVSLSSRWIRRRRAAGRRGGGNR